MSLSEEITKLAALKDQGALTEEEFEQAKKKLLSTPVSNRPHPRSISPQRNYSLQIEDDDSLGEAANRYVSFRIIASIIGAILFLLVGAPMMCTMNRQIDNFPSTTFPSAFPR